MISFSSWSVLTVDFLVVLHLSLAGVTLAALLHLVNAKWRFDIRVISVSFFALFPLAFVLLLILLFGGSLTFPWVGSFEKLPRWNNLGFLAAREILGFLAVGTLYGLFIKFQAKAERSAEDLHNFKMVATLIPFAHVLFCTMVSWDFEMTLLPNWESSIFAMYHFVSAFGMFLAVLVLSLYFLDKTKSFITPPPEHLYNYIAQMMLAFTILWVYTFFAQYLIIWYGNFPEETERLWQMQDGYYSGLFWAFFALKFVIPFVTLVFPFSRHSHKVIIAVASSVALGSWLERYTWISGAYPTPHMPMTGLFDIGVTLVVFGAAAAIVRARLRRNQLIR
ncbi:MAG: hypothetical protein KGI47_00265 [Betaproteobacteria bacterium]|nr:hypothetical protein [Betaproteobacteria bacterium]MDE2622052.1 hypothetical protein [Betaproteobacteria bacterium]